MSSARLEAFVGVAEGNPLPGWRTSGLDDLLATSPDGIVAHGGGRIYFSGIYFGGLPRFAKVNPRESAVQRSRLASLSASLRSGPGGIRRARSSASAARISESILSGDRCVSLSMVQLIASSRQKPAKVASLH